MLRSFFLSFILLACLQSQAAPLCESIFETSPEVFGYGDHDSWGKQIYLHELSQVRFRFVMIEGKPWAEMQEILIAMDVRKSFFHLRVLSQSYEKLDPKFFSQQTIKYKNIEYLLGRVGLYQEVKNLSLQMHEPKLAVYFDDLASEHSDQLKQAFSDLGFIKNPVKAVRRLEKEYNKYEKWPSAKKDREFLLKDTIEFSQKINDKIKRNAFDKDDLEEGLHKLRRSLREILYRVVNLQSLSEAVDEGVLPASLAKWYDELKLANPNILTSPYMPASIPEVKKPVHLPKKLDAMVTEIVNVIGADKDKQEPLMYLEQAAKDLPNLTDLDRARLLKKIKKMSSVLENQREIADDFQSRIRKTGLLDTYIEFLKHEN